MENVKYTVVAESLKGELLSWDSTFNKETAIKLVLIMKRKFPRSEVFVQTFRTSDGREGFLNKDGYSFDCELW